MYIVGTKAMYNDRKLYIKNLDLVIETDCTDEEIKKLETHCIKIKQKNIILYKI